MISKTSTGINFLGIPSIVIYMEEVLKLYPNPKNKNNLFIYNSLNLYNN